MQSADKSQAQQQSASNAQPAQGLVQQVGGPTPISLDLLHFVGGGKGAAMPAAAPCAPHNGW